MHIYFFWCAFQQHFIKKYFAKTFQSISKVALGVSPQFSKGLARLCKLQSYCIYEIFFKIFYKCGNSGILIITFHILRIIWRNSRIVLIPTKKTKTKKTKDDKQQTYFSWYRILWKFTKLYEFQEFHALLVFFILFCLSTTFSVFCMSDC